VEGAKVSRYVFMAVLLILTYLAFRLVQPFFTYVFMGVILTIAVYPFYKWFSKRIRNKKISSLAVIVLILLIIIIPSTFIISALVKETVNFIGSFDPTYFEKANEYVIKVLGPNADLHSNLDQLLVNLKDFVVKSTFSIAGSVADVSLGLFVMFFIMYYGFAEGEKWTALLNNALPFKKEQRKNLAENIKKVTKAVIYGQIFIAIIQGVLGGIGLFMIGVPNAIFWGFIMTVLAFLPVVGTGLVWIPAGFIEIINKDILGGIFILVYGVIVVSGVNAMLSPLIISEGGKIHPIVALIGVLGGLKVFGLIGIIIGPIIAALFMTMAEFFYKDYVKKNNGTKSHKNL